jgi:hypothetical protein
MRRLGGESEQARVRDRRKMVLGLMWVTGADLSVKRDPASHWQGKPFEFSGV